MKKPVHCAALFVMMVMLVSVDPAWTREPGTCAKCHASEEFAYFDAGRVLSPAFIRIGTEGCPSMNLVARESFLTVSRLVKLAVPAKKAGGQVKEDYDRLWSRWLSLAHQRLQSAEAFMAEASIIRENLDGQVFRPLWGERRGKWIGWGLGGLIGLVVILTVVVFFRTCRVRRRARLESEEHGFFFLSGERRGLFSRS